MQATNSARVQFLAKAKVINWVQLTEAEYVSVCMWERKCTCTSSSNGRIHDFWRSHSDRSSKIVKLGGDKCGGVRRAVVLQLMPSCRCLNRYSMTCEAGKKVPDTVCATDEMLLWSIILPHTSMVQKSTTITPDPTTSLKNMPNLTTLPPPSRIPTMMMNHLLWLNVHEIIVTSSKYITKQ